MATISENLEALKDIKSSIKEIIEAKGVEVGDAPFTDYAELIAEIKNLPDLTDEDKQAIEDIVQDGSTEPIVIDMTNDELNSELDYIIEGEEEL